MDIKEEAQIRKLTNALNTIRILDTTLPIQTMVALLVVAVEEGQSVSEVARRAGLQQSSASRNVSSLTDWSYNKRPGLGLVEYRQDPMNLSIKALHLTKKGAQVLRQIAAILSQPNEE